MLVDLLAVERSSSGGTSEKLPSDAEEWAELWRVSEGFCGIVSSNDLLRAGFQVPGGGPPSLDTILSSCGQFIFLSHVVPSCPGTL